MKQYRTIEQMCSDAHSIILRNQKETHTHTKLRTHWSKFDSLFKSVVVYYHI